MRETPPTLKYLLPKDIFVPLPKLLHKDIAMEIH